MNEGLAVGIALQTVWLPANAVPTAQLCRRPPISQMRVLDKPHRQSWGWELGTGSFRLVRLADTKTSGKAPGTSGIGE